MEQWQGQKENHHQQQQKELLTDSLFTSTFSHEFHSSHTIVSVCIHNNISSLHIDGSRNYFRKCHTVVIHCSCDCISAVSDGIQEPCKEQLHASAATNNSYHHRCTPNGRGKKSENSLSLLFKSCKTAVSAFIRSFLLPLSFVAVCIVAVVYMRVWLVSRFFCPFTVTIFTDFLYSPLFFFHGICLDLCSVTDLFTKQFFFALSFQLRREIFTCYTIGT